MLQLQLGHMNLGSYPFIVVFSFVSVFSVGVDSFLVSSDFLTVSVLSVLLGVDFAFSSFFGCSL